MCGLVSTGVAMLMCFHVCLCCVAQLPEEGAEEEEEEMEGDEEEMEEEEGDYEGEEEIDVPEHEAKGAEAKIKHKLAKIKKMAREPRKGNEPMFWCARRTLPARALLHVIRC